MENSSILPIKDYNAGLSPTDKAICDALLAILLENLTVAEYKIWHANPVWFIDGNPIVGYSKQKNGIRLLFWSGDSFNEAALKPGTGKFKDASIFYTAIEQIDSASIASWLQKAQDIQWDYKNIVKRKGVLERLK